jgi:cold shock CspA family protein
MAKSQETYNKKEKDQKREKKKKEKVQKKEERKANSNKGKGLDDMIAYVDEFGNLSSTPPDPRNKKVINVEDIEIGVSKKEDTEPVDLTKSGIVTFYDVSKGFGFIKDSQNKDSYFFHVKGLIDQVKENDKVSFETEMGKKGLNAVRVKLIK